MSVCFNILSGKVHLFSWSAIWLPSYHKLHKWLRCDWQKKFMVCRPGCSVKKVSSNSTREQAHSPYELLSVEAHVMEHHLVSFSIFWLFLFKTNFPCAVWKISIGKTVQVVFYSRNVYISYL